MIPEERIRLSFFVNLSLKIITPSIKEKRIVPTFNTGKNIVDGSIPASVVLRRLHVAKAIPIPTETKDFLLICLIFSFRLASENIREIIPASIKERKTNSVLCSGNSDFCWTFCIIPSPPDEIIAVINGKIYLLFNAVSVFFDLHAPDIIIVIITSIIPEMSKADILSFQKTEPEIVGRTKPSE